MIRAGRIMEENRMARPRAQYRTTWQPPDRLESRCATRVSVCAERYWPVAGRELNGSAILRGILLL